MMLMACQKSIEEMHCDFHFGLCVNSETIFVFWTPFASTGKTCVVCRAVAIKISTTVFLNFSLST